MCNHPRVSVTIAACRCVQPTIGGQGGNMTRKAFKLALVALLLACLSVPGMATAGGAGKDCSPLGTWFGVDPDTHVLTGWMSSSTGQSSNEGTISFDSRTFDPTLFGTFPTAVPGGSDKGVWKRTGGNIFNYSFMGIAVDSSNAIVWIGKTSGTITMLADCKTEKITAVMAVYLPTDNPFEGEPYFELDLGEVYAYRYTLR